jgi:ABC-2 type transport system ATP-binding protein
LLLALISPTSGSANIFGKDCIKFAPLIAKDIGYLPKENYFYQNLTVKQMLEYAESLYKKSCFKRASELCETFSLDKSMQLNDLSEVSIKKLNIVCALLNSPKLLIVDEPFYNLDIHSKKIFTDCLIQENLKGTTILFITENYLEAEKLCNKIAFLHEGRLIRVLGGEEFKFKKVKKIRFMTNDKVDEDLFYNIEKISHYEYDKGEARFMFRGNTNHVLKRLMRLNIHDIFIEEQSLEEMYKNYFL